MAAGRSTGPREGIEDSQGGWGGGRPGSGEEQESRRGLWVLAADSRRGPWRGAAAGWGSEHLGPWAPLAYAPEAGGWKGVLGLLVLGKPCARPWATSAAASSATQRRPRDDSPCSPSRRPAPHPPTLTHLSLTVPSNVTCYCPSGHVCSSQRAKMIFASRPLASLLWGTLLLTRSSAPCRGPLPDPDPCPPHVRTTGLYHILLFLFTFKIFQG